MSCVVCKLFVECREVAQFVVGRELNLSLGLDLDQAN